MNKDNRKFSIPYSPYIEPEKYLNLIEQYNQYIENIYLGIPQLNNHISLQINTDENYNLNTLRFLKQSKNKYKTIITYNTISINEDIDFIFDYFETTIYPLIEKYNINGFILTNFNLAKKIKKDFPNIELHTSCNAFQWNLRQMEMWANIGVEIFNPPREAARTPSMLKEMSNAGFKLKVLLNEACIYGCAYMYNHSCVIAENKKDFFNCGNYDLSNVFRTNLFLPRWLNHIDEYTYTYKLSGRNVNYKKMKTILDAYILQKPIQYIHEYSTYSSANPINLLANINIKIKDSDIPDKLIYCECKNCKDCLICKELLSKYIGE